MPEFLAESYGPRDAPSTAARTGDAVMTVPIEIPVGVHAITASGRLPHNLCGALDRSRGHSGAH
jgi:hypothetical protein